MSVCLSVCPSVCLYVCPFVCMSVCLCVCMSVLPSVCPSVCLSVIHVDSYKTSSHKTHLRGPHSQTPLSYFSFQPVLHDWCDMCDFLKNNFHDKICIYLSETPYENVEKVHNEEKDEKVLFCLDQFIIKRYYFVWTSSL